MIRKENSLEQGQGLVEYIIGIIFLAIIAFIVYQVGWPYISSILNPPAQPIPSSSESHSAANQDLKFGNITPIETKLERVVDVDTIRLPNCEGSSELSVEKALTKSVSKNISFLEETSLAVSPLFNLASIQAHIAKSLNVDTGSEISNTTVIEVKAAPGTTVIYEIAWLEVSSQATIEVIADGETYIQPFSISDSLEADIRQPTREACATATP